jgi:hypothetical protein
VRLDETLAEGYVEFKDLSPGWVETHRFWAHVETGSGVRKIKFGDRMEVQIAEIDLGSRSMRLSPAGRHQRKERQYRPERRGKQRNRRR